MTCLPYDEEVPDSCALDWDAELSDDRMKVTIGMKFKSPPKVSQGDENDKVLIKLWGAASLKTDKGK